MTLDDLIGRLVELRDEMGSGAEVYTLDPETGVVVPPDDVRIDGGPVAERLGGGAIVVVSLAKPLGLS